MPDEIVSGHHPKTWDSLYEKFLALKWAEERLGRNNKPRTKFKSYTIQKWDIFNQH